MSDISTSIQNESLEIKWARRHYSTYIQISTQDEPSLNLAMAVKTPKCWHLKSIPKKDPSVPVHWTDQPNSDAFLSCFQ